MYRVGLSCLHYLSRQSFDESSFCHRDARIMDRLTKFSITAASQLYVKSSLAKIGDVRIGVALGTTTGPLASINEFNSILKEKGYIGINPSKFPNIMLSTCLSRITAELHATGPSTVFFLKETNHYPLIFSYLQIVKKRSDAMLVLYADEGSRCFGMVMERENLVKQRGMDLRFYCNLDKSRLTVKEVV